MWYELWPEHQAVPRAQGLAPKVRNWLCPEVALPRVFRMAQGTCSIDRYHPLPTIKGTSWPNKLNDIEFNQRFSTEGHSAREDSVPMGLLSSFRAGVLRGAHHPPVHRTAPYKDLCYPAPQGFHSPRTGPARSLISALLWALG